MKAQGLSSQLSHDANAEVIYFISTLLNAEWRIRFFLIFQSNIKYLKYEQHKQAHEDTRVYPGKTPNPGKNPTNLS